jgi:tRNA nucleotidyltransferase (CCA-adding enzyme)
MRIAIPEKVKFIIDTLERDGFEAFAVGGCVRDSILNKQPKDWDITTNASPEEVKSIFKRTIDTGIEHGTVTIMLDKEGFEVTTYRIDGKYEDNRHPSEVIFTRNLRDDLLRRDFTINAMAYNESVGLVDLFGGINDLENGIIKAVGDPLQRFSEDALRIMRGVRFAAVLGFEIEEKTFDAMKVLAHNLASISAERVREELLKLIMGKYPEKLHLAYKAGITKVVFPEWDEMEKTKQENRHHVYDCAEHTIVALKAAMRLLGIFDFNDLTEYALLNDTYKENLNFICRKPEQEIEKVNQVICFATLLHDIAKPSTKTFSEDGEAHFYGHQQKSSEMAVQIMQRLKFDNDSIKAVKLLIEHHDDRYKLNWQKGTSSARRVCNQIGFELASQLMILQAADTLAQSPDYYEENFISMIRMRSMLDEIVQDNECFSLKDLAINGKDLIGMGVKSGPEIGRILKELLNKVIEQPELNKKEALRELAEELIN